jgi:hypothetical protein
VTLSYSQLESGLVNAVKSFPDSAVDAGARWAGPINTYLLGGLATTPGAYGPLTGIGTPGLAGTLAGIWSTPTAAGGTLTAMAIAAAVGTAIGAGVGPTGATSAPSAALVIAAVNANLLPIFTSIPAEGTSREDMGKKVARAIHDGVAVAIVMPPPVGGGPGKLSQS